MIDVPLHTGTEHPDLLWILVSSILAFAAGLGIGSVSDRVRGWLRPAQSAPSTDRSQ